MRHKLLLLTAAALCFATTLRGQVEKTEALKISQHLPIAFEANQGQVDKQVKFLAHMGKHAIFLTPEEAVLALYTQHTVNTSDVVPLRMEWVGANQSPDMEAEGGLPGRVNYIIGRDPAKWHTNLPTFARVRYRNLYPGVDAVFYGRDGEIEYDLRAAPGADIKKIRIALTGAESLRVAQNGDLVLRMKNGQVRQRRPNAYQEIAGQRRRVSAHYLIHSDRTIGYEVTGWDRNATLVIDPRLSYSTYIGGTVDDSVNSVAVDQFGRAYATGSTTFGFPTKNAFQGNQVGIDAFVTKFFATGAGLIYSTFLGGSGRDVGAAIAVDRFGSVYVAGQTFSTDFPVTSGAFQRTNHGVGDAFVTKLNPSGSSLAYSTFLGGNTIDEVTGLALDSAHRVYITGTTCSPDFPLRNAFQSTTNNVGCFLDNGVLFSNGFVTRLNASGTNVDYSTYLRGSVRDRAAGIAVDGTFHAYVTGATASADFPTTSGAFQRTLRGEINAFVTKFSADGRSLVYSTLLGGSGAPQTFSGDQGRAIAVDSSNRAYVTGGTTSPNFPVTPGAFQRTIRGTTNAFVTKLQIDGAGLIYSTFLGGHFSTQGNSIAVDSFGRAHVAGFTTSDDFPLIGAIQTHIGGAEDAFVTKLFATGGGLIYSTFLGGAGRDFANSLRLDSNGNAYVGGSTTSTNFPTTAGAFSRTLRGASDGWVAKIAP